MTTPQPEPSQEELHVLGPVGYVIAALGHVRAEVGTYPPLSSLAVGLITDSLLAQGVTFPGMSITCGVGTATPADLERSALAELVALKDGPRDERYRGRKEQAWSAARAALASRTPGEPRERQDEEPPAVQSAVEWSRSLRRMGYQVTAMRSDLRTLQAAAVDVLDALDLIGEIGEDDAAVGRLRDALSRPVATAPAGVEDNERAAQVLGKRAEDVGREGVLVINFPGEEGYHCPVCVYPPIVNGDYDERLTWSEYRTMLWCYVCERDYPSSLCLPDDLDKAIKVYLWGVEQVTTARTAPLSRLLRGMARRTAILRGKLLDETLPDRGVVAAVASRTPGEPRERQDGEPDDTDMTPDEFRAAMTDGTPVRVVAAPPLRGDSPAQAGDFDWFHTDPTEETPVIADEEAE